MLCLSQSPDTRFIRIFQSSGQIILHLPLSFKIMFWCACFIIYKMYEKLYLLLLEGFKTGVISMRCCLRVISKNEINFKNILIKNHLVIVVICIKTWIGTTATMLFKIICFINIVLMSFK